MRSLPFPGELMAGSGRVHGQMKRKEQSTHAAANSRSPWFMQGTGDKSQLAAAVGATDPGEAMCEGCLCDRLPFHLTG